MIKQGINKKMKVYYGWIFKLANCLQDNANESLFTTLIHVVLVPYLRITIKRNTLFKHKEVISIYEKIWTMQMINGNCLNHHRNPSDNQNLNKLLDLLALSQNHSYEGMMPLEFRKSQQ
jgi:hypothetical protein